MSRSNNHGYNLLRIRAIHTIISWAWFPYIIQIIMLMVFTALAVNGWWHFAPEGVNDKLYAKTNITNLLIWGLWWPAIVWITKQARDKKYEARSTKHEIRNTKYETNPKFQFSNVQNPVFFIGILYF